MDVEKKKGLFLYGGRLVLLRTTDIKKNKKRIDVFLFAAILFLHCWIKKKRSRTGNKEVMIEA